MKDNSYIIIELMLRQMIKNYKDDPKRSVRNIVDMAMHFAKGRFQRNFFEIAQRILDNESSAYYELVDNLLMNVDTERLLTFGMNVGFYSCTRGAEKIREIEAAENFDIPWSMTLEINETGDREFVLEYTKLFEQGKELGIHTYLLDAKCRLNNLLDVISKQDDCAFALVVDPEIVTDDFLEDLSGFNNTMLCVRYGDTVEEACRKIHSRNMLCSVYYEYDENNIDTILNGKLYREIEYLNPMLCIFGAKEDCNDEIRKQVARFAKTSRQSQQQPFLVWESKFDSMAVDTIISDDPCSAYFDSNGYFHALFHSYSETNGKTDYNFHSNSLRFILSNIFYKKK